MAEKVNIIAKEGRPSKRDVSFGTDAVVRLTVLVKLFQVFEVECSGMTKHAFQVVLANQTIKMHGQLEKNTKQKHCNT